MSEQIERTITDELADMGVSIHSVFIPASHSDRKDQINWSCTITTAMGSYTTHYSQGIAHIPGYKFGRRTIHDQEIIDYALEYGKGRMNWNRPASQTMPKLPQPSVDEVLWCLLMDAQGTDEKFEDWAPERGYDADSISALEIYRECEKTAKALRKMFTAEQIDSLYDMFADY